METKTTKEALITTNLGEKINIKKDSYVVAYTDTFLSGWGRAEGLTHNGVILSSEDVHTVKYKLLSNDDKTIKNIRIVKLSTTLKYNSVSYYNGFNVANIKPIKAA